MWRSILCGRKVSWGNRLKFKRFRFKSCNALNFLSSFPKKYPKSNNYQFFVCFLATWWLNVWLWKLPHCCGYSSWGNLKYFSKKFLRHAFFSRQEIEAWITRHKKSPTTECEGQIQNALNSIKFLANSS